MFVSNFTHSVDDKGRFIMPSKFREQLDGRFIATKGMDGNCLYLYHITEWEEFVRRLRALPSSKPEIRTLQRHFITEAEQVDIDRQGRCLISANLRTFANITAEIKLMGMDNKIELWSLEAWNEFKQKDTADISEIAGSLDLII